MSRLGQFRQKHNDLIAHIGTGLIAHCRASQSNYHIGPALVPAMLLDGLGKKRALVHRSCSFLTIIIQCMVFHRKLGIHAFWLAVFGLQVAKALQVSGFHTAGLSSLGVGKPSNGVDPLSEEASA